MARSGLSDGSAAITGLISTSARPAEAAKITEPMKIPAKAVEGKNVGHSAYTSSPTTVSAGMTRTVLRILNLCEKKENTRSMPSCVQKLTSTNSPKRVKEMPYMSRNVRNRIGDRLAHTDMEILVV